MTKYEQWNLAISAAAFLVAVGAIIVSYLAHRQTRRLGDRGLAETVRQHKIGIRPFVTASVGVASLQGVLGYRCVLLGNAGPGIAFDVKANLQAVRSGGQVEPVRYSRPELRPGDPEPIAHHAGTNQYESVWGAIAYQDAEGTCYWSACKKGSPHWDWGEGPVPLG